MTTRIKIPAMILALCCGWMSSAFAQQEAPKEAPEAPKEVTCFESRKGASEVVQRDLKPGLPNVKCSPKTGAVLWWSDALDGTVPMGDMPEVAKAHSDKAFVKPRSEKARPDAPVRHGMSQRRGRQSQPTQVAHQQETYPRADHGRHGA
ncbi:MAG: hypothetical protein IPG42_04260 [Betaproteobacteria bacterium]|nr:hypothetical protein [Betaproteobacteria bacterium]